ncbi:unnamed protein product [Brachionus calyciflorus]|uniref:Serine/threonine-protein kinase 19 n=1 Tax=Brachionus calyciflorus TaxID=104777 RepID=A0A813M597_9BILA|nr:unnamed protein product [Brachionus calyciflorus]
MSNKRKATRLGSESEVIIKKSKPTEQNSEHTKLEKDYNKIIELLSDNGLNDKIEHPVLYALNFFKSIFPNKMFENLPEIIHLHQLYSLFKNRTEVDREIDSLRSESKIILFHFESNQQKEILICFTDDFKDYIGKHVKENCKRKNLIDLFMEKILLQNNLTIDSDTLIDEYKLSDSDISILVQEGLLGIKDSSNFWFSIPNLGKFRRILVETRKSLLDLLRRQKYKEINLRLFFNNLLIQKHKNFRSVNRLGAIYVLCDLIGNDLVRKIDSPMGIVIKLN